MNTSWPAGLKEFLEDKFRGIDARLARLEERFDDNDIKQDEILKAIGRRFEEHDKDIHLLRALSHDSDGRLLKLESNTPHTPLLRRP